MDHIIVLQNGTISECGTYKELLKGGGDFASFLNVYGKENDESLYLFLETTRTNRKTTMFFVSTLIYLPIKYKEWK